MVKKKKSGKINTLICEVPGLSKPIEIAFNDSKLPVCSKCKKIYKTRKLCRVRDCHTDIPWNTTYICFKVDDSCLNEKGEFDCSSDDDFDVELIKEEDVKTTYFAEYEKLGDTAAICRPCKIKNYTKYHCRASNCHQNLPWTTFYAVIKKRVAEDGKNLKKVPSIETDGETSVPTLESPGAGEKDTALENNEGKDKRDYRPMDMHLRDRETIFDVSESKTFLLIIEPEGTILHWLNTTLRARASPTFGTVLPHGSPSAVYAPAPQHPASNIPLPNLPNHEPYHGRYGYQHQNARALHHAPPHSNSTEASHNSNDGEIEPDQIEPMPYHPFAQSNNPKSRGNPSFHSNSKCYPYPYPESYRYENHNFRTNHLGQYRPSYTTATHDNRNMLRRHLECGNFTVTPVRQKQKDTSKFSDSPESPSIMPSPSAEYHNIGPSNPNNIHNQSQRLEHHYGEDYDRRKRRRHDNYPKQSSYHYNQNRWQSTNHDYERSHPPYGHLNKHQDYRDPYGYHDDALPLEIDNNYSSGETRKDSFGFEERSRLPEDLEYYPSDEKHETSSK